MICLAPHPITHGTLYTPQASVVAALRSEIAALDAQMNGRPVPEVLPMPANATRPSRGPGSFSPGLAGPGSFGGQVGSRPPGSGPPAGAVRSRTEQLADKAYQMVGAVSRQVGFLGAGAWAASVWWLFVSLRHEANTQAHFCLSKRQHGKCQ